MARTIKAIYEELTEGKFDLESTPVSADLLNQHQKVRTELGLDSKSKVAEWKILFWCVAFVLWTHEQLWNVFWKKASRLETNLKMGSLAWYKEQILKYSKDGSNPIHYVSVREVDDIIQIRIADENKVKLDKKTLDDFVPYFENEILLAGADYYLSNALLDVLRIKFDVLCGPKLDPSTQKGRDEIKNQLDARIREYIDQELPFNGVLNLSKLEDKLQKDPDIESILIRESKFRVADEELLELENWKKIDDSYGTTEYKKDDNLDKCYKPFSGFYYPATGIVEVKTMYNFIDEKTSSDKPKTNEN
ncbi:MAG: hypothetical protein MI784_12105 [Cytophagales bacterium]|nr:hypothetical protein [Cytophagales bacterium]